MGPRLDANGEAFCTAMAGLLILGYELFWGTNEASGHPGRRWMECATPPGGCQAQAELARRARERNGRPDPDILSPVSQVVFLRAVNVGGRTLRPKALAEGL